MTLSETWFIDGYIDFELQKYRLLAYLKEVNKYFHETKLYPQLSDMIFHYNNLVANKENKQFLQNSLPKELTKVDMQKLELTYEQFKKAYICTVMTSAPERDQVQHYLNRLSQRFPQTTIYIYGFQTQHDFLVMPPNVKRLSCMRDLEPELKA